VLRQFLPRAGRLLSAAALLTACISGPAPAETVEAPVVVQTVKAIGILEPNDTDDSNARKGNAGAAPLDTQKIPPVPLMVIDRGFWEDNGFVFDKEAGGIRAPKGHLKTWSEDSYKVPANVGWGADHGTFVAGVIGGALPQKNGMSTGFARLSGTSSENAMYLCDFGIQSTQYCLRSYLRSLRDHRPQFVNMSLACEGSGCSNEGKSTSSMDVDDAVWTDGVLVIAAAGNDGRNRHTYDGARKAGEHDGLTAKEWPRVGAECGSKNALCVGAVTNEASPKFNQITNDGVTDDGRLKPDVFAIGTYEGNCFVVKGSKKPDITKPCTQTGTSMAAPMVTATLATVAARHPEWQGKPHVFKTWAMLAATRDKELSQITIGAASGRSGWLRFSPALQNTDMTNMHYGDGTANDAEQAYTLPKPSPRRNRLHFILSTIERSVDSVSPNLTHSGCDGFAETDPDCRYVYNEVHLAAYTPDGELLTSTAAVNNPKRDTVRHISLCLNDPRLKDTSSITVRMVAHDVPDPARYPYKWAMGGKVDFSDACR